MSKSWSLDLRNGWTDFDEIWYACRPYRGILKFKISDRSVRWGLSYDRAKIGILAGRDGWALLGETTVSPDKAKGRTLKKRPGQFPIFIFVLVKLVFPNQFQ